MLPPSYTPALVRWAAALLASSALAFAQQPSETPVVKNLPEFKLAGMPNLPDCFTAELERGNADNGPQVILFRGASGCSIPWHWHTPDEHLMMVSGTSRLEMKEKSFLLRSGAFAFVPAHHVHRFSCPTTCLLYAYSDAPFDIHYLDEGGKEIPTEEALKALRKNRTNRKPQ